MSYSADELILASSCPAGLGHVVSGGTREIPGAYIPYEHLVLLNDLVLRAVQEQDAVFAGTSEGGEWDRLIISMPPRHGKSETTSRYTPAWYLGARPDRKVILASYEARFAESWGRKARDILEADGEEIFGVRVSDKSAAAAAWEIAGRQGGMFTAGVGGPITGKGAHLLLIDDPIKNAEEAQSETIQVKQLDWWRSTARTRLQKGAIVIVVMTRWHEADLAGQLLRLDEELSEDERENWRVLNLPAIAEPEERVDEDGAKTLVMNDPLGREEGQPLCPELGFDERWAKRTRAAVGSYWWNALYQGRPRPADGLLFKRHDFRYFVVQPPSEQWPLGLYLLEDEDGLHPLDPKACVHFQTADTADSEKEMSDYTVVTTWAITPVERQLLVVDVQRAQFERERAATMLEGAYKGMQPRPVTLRVENAGPSGPKVIKALLRKGLPIASDTPDTDKVTRSLVMVALYEAHRVYHRRGAQWLRDWEDEYLAFPNGANDDQVDTGSYAAIALPKLAGAGVKQQEKGKTEFGGLLQKDL